MSLTDDQIRDLFSAYHDRELPGDQAEAVRAALEHNADLKQEYESFARMLTGLSNLGLNDVAGKKPGPEPAPGPNAPGHTETAVDLLHGVQRKLHARSAGKFYGDRWARTVGLIPLELAAFAILVGLVLLYFWMTSISIQPAGNTPAVQPVPPAQTQGTITGGGTVINPGPAAR